MSSSEEAWIGEDHQWVLSVLTDLWQGSERIKASLTHSPKVTIKLETASHSTPFDCMACLLCFGFLLFSLCEI